MRRTRLIIPAMAAALLGAAAWWLSRPVPVAVAVHEAGRKCPGVLDGPALALCGPEGAAIRSAALEGLQWFETDTPVPGFEAPRGFVF